MKVLYILTEIDESLTINRGVFSNLDRLLELKNQLKEYKPFNHFIIEKWLMNNKNAQPVRKIYEDDMCDLKHNIDEIIVYDKNVYKEYCDGDRSIPIKCKCGEEINYSSHLMIKLVDKNSDRKISEISYICCCFRPPIRSQNRQ